MFGVHRTYHDKMAVVRIQHSTALLNLLPLIFYGRGIEIAQFCAINRNFEFFQLLQDAPGTDTYQRDVSSEALAG
jgi:hypothetical protein